MSGEGTVKTAGKQTIGTVGESRAQERLPKPASCPAARPGLAREIVIDFAAWEPYECVAMLAALLAYPNLDADQEKRETLRRSLCYLNIRARSEMDAEWSTTSQRIKPIDVFADPKTIERDMRALKRRLKHRMIAARMAMAFFNQVVQKGGLQLPEGVARVSLNELAKMVVDDLGGDDETNIPHRIWRPSRPVIHLAAAIARAADRAKREANEDIHVGHLLTDPIGVRRIIEQAGELSALLCSNRNFPIAPETMIRVIAIG